MSADLSWMIIKNSNAFLSKKTNIKKPFSKEPMNLTNLASKRYNGLVHDNSIGVESAPNNKGFTVITKKRKLANKPGKSLVKMNFTSGPRRSLFKLRKYLLGNNYRKDLIQASLRRASAILESQKRAALTLKKLGKSKKSDA